MPTLTFKVSPAEARAIRQRARLEKATLSKFLRERALGVELTVPLRRVIKRHPISGVLVDATPGPRVTQAQIDAALFDFP